MSVEAQPSTKNKEEGYCGNELSACLSQGSGPSSRNAPAKQNVEAKGKIRDNR